MPATQLTPPPQASFSSLCARRPAALMLASGTDDFVFTAAMSAKEPEAAVTHDLPRMKFADMAPGASGFSVCFRYAVLLLRAVR
jgi:hypothetical protein